jgi:Fic family protein
MDGRLEASVLSPAVHQLLLNIARVRNVVSSLRIEGEDIDLEAARRAIETGRGSTGTEKLVLRLASEYATIHGTRPSKLPDPHIQLVLDLHKRVFQGIEDANPGALKGAPNGVKDLATGMFTFEATPPRRTAAELERLFEWFEAQKDRLPPAVVGALFFAEFQAIHPFHDGNGRIGRLLNLLVLKKVGYENAALVPLDGRFFRTQDTYYEALRSTNDGKSWQVWTRYYARQLERAYDLALRRADLKPFLDEHTRASVRKVLEWVLTGDGTSFKHGDYPNPSGLSPAAVSLALSDLVDEGVLEARGDKRGRTYRLSTVFLKKAYGVERD